jgi:hypothetical protein
MKISGGSVVFLGLSLALAVVLTACAPAPEATPTLPALDYLIEQLVPELTVPEGAQPLGGGGGGGGYGMGIDSFFLSDLSIADVYKHYFDQLEASGWQIITQQETENSMTSFWEVTDSDRAAWSGKMEVIYSPPDFLDTYIVKVKILLPQ